MSVLLTKCTCEEPEECELGCPACPVVSSLSRTTVNIGDTITIFGKNFSRFGEGVEDKVTIGGQIATPTGIVSDDKIVVEIPSDLETGIADIVVCAANAAHVSNRSTLCSNDKCLDTSTGSLNQLFITQGTRGDGENPEGDISFTEMFGSSVGAEFIDFYSSSDVKRISGIRLTAASHLHVYAISMQWEDHNGQKEWTSWRGNENWGEYDEVFFDEDEEWIGVMGYTDWRAAIYQLTFITNKRAIGPYGNTSSASNFTLMNVGKIIGLSTRVNNSRVASVGLVVRE